MTKQETNKILALILEVYPTFGKDRNPELTSKLWSTLFEDEPYEWVEKALITFFATDTKGFPPTPGNIKDKIRQLTKTEEPTEMEAWNLVVKAASNGCYGADEEFRKLPKDIQEIVGSPAVLREWSMMDADEFNTVIGSNFQRSYKAKAESRRVYGMLPSSILQSLPKVEEKKLVQGVVALPDIKEEEDYQYTEMPQSFRDVAQRVFGKSNV